MDGDAVEGILYSLIVLGVAIGCVGVIIVGSVGACVLAVTLYACGCLVCPQHDNNDIPMEVMQDDLESAGNGSDLVETI